MHAYFTEEGSVEAVNARMGRDIDPRLATVMASLVKHLHAFAKEVELTQDEWDYGVDFLTRTGQICSTERQEFILLSDTLGLSMLIGRFTLMVPVLAIAGSLGRKQKVPASAGTFPTGTPLFAGLLVGVVVIVVGLTYFPVLALGPLVEHLGL